MNRYQFFSLLEANLKEDNDIPIAAEGVKHAYKKAREHGAGVLGGIRAGAKRAKRSFVANPDLRVAVGKRVGGAAAVGGAAIAGGMHFMRKRAEAAKASTFAGKAKAGVEKVISAAKANPKKALAAGAAGLGGMMFMRKKDKSKK